MIGDLAGAVNLASGFESCRQGLVQPYLVKEAIELGLGKPSKVTDETVDRSMVQWVQVGRHGGVRWAVIVGRSEMVGLLIHLEDLWGIGEVRFRLPRVLGRWITDPLSKVGDSAIALLMGDDCFHLVFFLTFDEVRWGF